MFSTSKAGVPATLLAFSLELSLQLAALIAFARPHKPRFLGGTGGATVRFVEFDKLMETGVEVVSRERTGGCMIAGGSSSHIRSIILVRTKAHIEHVVRRRERHHPFVQRG